MPSGVDLTSALRVERTKERQREMQQFRSRRLSDSFVSHVFCHTLFSNMMVTVCHRLEGGLETCKGMELEDCVYTYIKL